MKRLRRFSPAPDQEFTAKGKTVLAAGWKGIGTPLYGDAEKESPIPSDDEENALALDVPPFAEGQTFDNPASGGYGAFHDAAEAP